MTHMPFTGAPGDHVGPYRVIGPYPGGGFRALHIDHAQRAHLDVRSANAGDGWRERSVQLLRAASLLGSLDHPGIARILDRGVLPDRRPWIASELAEGVPLSDILARRTLAVDETLALVRELASVVAHAHAHQLVHSAIHPHAIVMRTGERSSPIQLGAWGDVRAFHTELDETIALTPYAAPETDYEGSADVYSIGVLAHRALTGRFPGAVSPELVAGVPGVVSSLVVGMLARDPAARPDACRIQVVTIELTGDRVLSGPRFSRPRWTPAPEPDGERLSSVIDLAEARHKRS